MAQNAAVALLQNEQVDAGVEVMKLMGDAFSGSSEPELAERAKSMMEQAQAIALQHASQQLQAGDEGALERLMATAKAAVESDTVQVQPLLMITQVSKDLEAEHPDAAKELSALAASGLEKLVSKENQDLTVLVTATRLAEMMDPPNEEIIAKANELVLARVEQDVAAPGVTAESLHQMLSEVAMQAEFSGDVELASKLYDAIGAAAAKIEDAEEIKGITQQLEAAKKRVGMVGKPLVVEGKLLDGQPFDWKPYEGKVVLVDFWATWCGPCIREFPNIKENYEAYHEQGFEVVGVNLDDDNKSVESFFEARGELPWTTVVSPDDSARGFNTPLAQASGVTAIPFVVLVGKDGNVEAIHVRGEQLGERLAKIFGPPPTSDVPETNIVPDDVPESVPEETPPEAPEDEPADAPATEPVPE
jgi:thiol-disulfide isomerase/thioredoxin